MPDNRATFHTHGFVWAVNVRGRRSIHVHASVDMSPKQCGRCFRPRGQEIFLPDELTLMGPVASLSPSAGPPNVWRRLLGRFQRPKIAWWEPSWSYRQKIWRSAGEVFRWRAVAGTTLVSLVLGAGLVAAVKWALPAVQLPPLWRMLLPIPVLYAYLAVMTGQHLVVPARVFVRRDVIRRSHGDQWFVKSTEITRLRITVFAPDRVRLRVFYRRKDCPRSRAFGIAPHVNLAALAELLPLAPQIWDARPRYDDRHQAR